MIESIVLASTIFSGILFFVSLGFDIFFYKDITIINGKRKFSKRLLICALISVVSLIILIGGVNTFYGRGFTGHSVLVNWCLNLLILLGFIPAGLLISTLAFFLILFIIGQISNLSHKISRKVKKHKDEDW